MKKTLLLIAVFALSVSLYAQNRAVSTVTKMPSVHALVSATETIDTLMPVSWDITGCTFTVYGCSNSTTGAYAGYITGNNSFGDKEKAQRYTLTGTGVAQVSDVLVYCYTTSPTHTSNTSVKLYTVNASTLAPTAITLGTTTAIPLNTLPSDGGAGGTFTDYIFPTPVWVGQKFFVSYVLPTGTGDTAVLVSTNYTTCPQTDSLSYEKWDTDLWYPIYRSYGGTDMRIDITLLPVISYTAGIDDNSFFDGIMMDQNQPNPANNITNIHYNLQTAGTVSLDIFDITGKKVLHSEPGFQTAGKHDMTVDVSRLGKGTYFYSLKSDEHRMTMKMIVE
jgi:hypothetical protein